MEISSLKLLRDVDKDLWRPSFPRSAPGGIFYMSEFKNNSIAGGAFVCFNDDILKVGFLSKASRGPCNFYGSISFRLFYKVHPSCCEKNLKNFVFPIKLQKALFDRT